MTVNISHHCDDPNRRSSESHQARLDGRVASEEDEVNVGMSAFEDLGQYKMFVGDTGLFVTLAFKDKDFTENILYNKLLNDKLSSNLGYLYENIVAQMLVCSLITGTVPLITDPTCFKIAIPVAVGTGT